MLVAGYGVLKPYNAVICMRSALYVETTYLCYPPDVLVAVFLCESEVFVQAEAHVVAIQTVRGVSEVE